MEAAGLGMVAHTFTCPGGLYFNVLTDGCDFKRNVDCGGKDTEDAPPSSTTTATPQSAEDDSEEDPQSLKDILSSIKAAGRCIDYLRGHFCHLFYSQLTYFRRS